MSRRTTRLALALAGALASGALVFVPAPAFAAPVAVDDEVAVYAGGTYTIDPLANDSTRFSLPINNNPLSLCGFTNNDPNRVYVEQSGDQLVVQVRDAIAGTVEIPYDACQGSERASAVVHVDITRLADLTGVKKRKGKVAFSNSNPVPVQVSWGSASGGRADATRNVLAGGTITIGTARKAIYWLALYFDDGVMIRVGDDTILNLQNTAKKAKAKPKKKPRKTGRR